MFKKTPLEMFEKVVIRKNKPSTDINSENLEEVENKSVEKIQKLLEDRLSLNEGITFAGSNLLHIENQTNRLNLLVKYAEKVYAELKKTSKTQVISILGSSLRAKELSKSIISSHLCAISSKSPLFSQQVQSAYELLHIFASDGEGIYYSESIDLYFSEKFRLSGCRFIAKLIDLEFPENCGIFRILMSQSDPVLQHLGLTHRALPNKNMDLHTKFKKNLETLGISFTETQDIMEILAVAVLITELDFATSSYTPAGQSRGNIYFLEDSKTQGKICKILGLIGDRLQDFLTVSSRQQGKEKLNNLRKLLVICAFEAFLNKINAALSKTAKDEFSLTQKLHKISIITSPEPKMKSNIEGVVSNLMAECQEFLSYEGFFSILSLLNEEKIFTSKVAVPLCRYIIELFLDKSHGVLYKFLSGKYWEELSKELIGDPVYNKIISITENLLTINNSWGSNLYYLPSLQYQFSQFPDAAYTDFLKRCSHRSLSYALRDFESTSYSQYIKSSISELFSSASQQATTIVYCYKDIKDVLNETSLISILNLPYKYIALKSTANIEGLKRIGCKVTMSEKWLFAEGNKENIEKFLKNGKAQDVFGIKISVDKLQMRGPKLTEYVEVVREKKREMKRSSSAKPRAYFTMFSIPSSKNSTKLLAGNLSGFKNYSYRSNLKEIVKIQAAWRGFTSRKYFKNLWILNKNAKTIQNAWRGFKTRQKFNLKKIIHSIIQLQRVFRIKYKKKATAAAKIQRFYLNKKKEKLSSLYNSTIILQKSTEKLLKTEKRHRERIQKSSSVQRIATFSPVLSRKTIELAESATQRDFSNLKIEDRLLLKGKLQHERRDRLIYQKKITESSKNPGKVLLNNGQFYEKGLRFLRDKKEAVNELKDNLTREELANCTFKPVIQQIKTSRTAMETVRDLYNWNYQKLANREKAATKKVVETQMQMLRPRALSSSSRICESKRNELEQKNEVIKQIKRNVSPYWPKTEVKH